MSPRSRAVTFSLAVLLSVAPVAFLAPPPASGAGLKMDLRLHGGFSRLAAADVNRGSGGMFDFYRLFIDYGGYEGEGGYRALHGGYDFGADLVVALGPRFGVGLGLGYLRSAGKGDLTLVFEDQVLDVTGGPSLSAIPLRLGLYYTLPVAGRLSLTANAGAAVYLGLRFHDLFAYDQGGLFGRQEIIGNRTSFSANLGGQAGLGLDYRFGARWGFFVEAQGRYARFQNFGRVTIKVASSEGGSQTRQGTVYLRSQTLSTDPPVVFTAFTVADTAPTPDPPDLLIREPRFDLSGFCLQAGIRIRL